MNGATQDHDPTGARSRACKHHLLVPGNRPTAGRRYRRRHCQRDLSGCTLPRPPRLCSRARRREGNGHAAAASAARNDCHTIVRVVVATRRSHHRDAGGPPGGLIDRFLCETARRSPIPFGRNWGLSWIIEIIHHAVAAKLLQHSAITPSLTYVAIIGGKKSHNQD